MPALHWPNPRLPTRPHTCDVMRVTSADSSHSRLTRNSWHDNDQKSSWPQNCRISFSRLRKLTEWQLQRWATTRSPRLCLSPQNLKQPQCLTLRTLSQTVKLIKRAFGLHFDVPDVGKKAGCRTSEDRSCQYKHSFWESENLGRNYFCLLGCFILGKVSEWVSVSLP